MGIGGLLVTMSMLREAQRLTRAVAAMVYKESEKTRSALGPRPPPCTLTIPPPAPVARAAGSDTTPARRPTSCVRARSPSIRAHAAWKPARASSKRPHAAWRAGRGGGLGQVWGGG